MTVDAVVDDQLSGPTLAGATISVGEHAAPIRVLIVDDDRALREGCASVLQQDGYQLMVVGRGSEALDLVRRRRFDILIVDLYMSGVSGMEILDAALAANPETIVILVTGNPSVASSIEGLRAGAWDYLPKPFSAMQLQTLVGRAAHAVRAAGDPGQGERELLSAGGQRETVMLLGASVEFRRAVDSARRVAQTSASVMITGESGTGKELIAQLIHQESKRANRAFVPINCAALPEPLLESELFGHRKGAFTGADRDKPGLIEMAHGGTLFLDELLDMPLQLQAKLLRVVQDGVIRRVGSEQRDAVVNLRVISATNRDPLEATRAGVLREDLYYRLRVVPIHLPPLRQRAADIPLLANHFLRQYWRRHRQALEAVPTFTPECLEFLSRRPWRGNVRELQNLLEHVAVIAAAGAKLSPSDLPLQAELGGDASVSDLGDSLLDNAYHDAKEQLMARFEHDYLRRLIGRADGNMSKAARLARIDRTTLYRLWEKHSPSATADRASANGNGPAGAPSNSAGARGPSGRARKMTTGEHELRLGVTREAD